MKPMNLHEYVKNIKLAGVFNQKQCTVIENIYIYFKDLRVYKVIVAVKPEMMKKAKRLGLYNQYTITPIGQTKSCFKHCEYPIIVKEFDVAKGSYIAVYNPNTSECTIYDGEKDEKEQIKGLRSSCNSRCNRTEYQNHNT